MANKKDKDKMSTTMLVTNCEQQGFNRPIESLIHSFRDKQVMLDRDLAMLYGVETRALNQAVKRNKERFPENYMFQLNDNEFADWKITNCDIQSKLGGF